MAKFYGAERSKYGNLTGQIICWPVEISNDPNSSVQKAVLPSGYLRCDGSVYNVDEYPQLAAVCGAGPTGKFIRRDINQNVLQTISDQQFAVPDLGSKYPKPTTGPDAGQYKSIREVAASGQEVNRSGIGIEATSTIGTTVDVTYEGAFVVPEQTINLRGRPAWTIGTTLGRRTDAEAVDTTGIHGHMHFHQGVRTRLKSNNEVDSTSPGTALEPRPMGMVGFKNASTVPLADWLVGMSNPNSTTNFPGNNQPPCRAIASSHWADDKIPFGDFDGSTLGGILGNPVAYGGACFNGGEDFEDTWKYNCLLPSGEWMDDAVTYNGGSQDGSLNTSTTNSVKAWDNYPIGGGNAGYLLNGVNPNYISGAMGLWGLACGVLEDVDDANANEDVEATFVLGGPGVANDWKDVSLNNVVPLQANADYVNAGNPINPSLYNEYTQTNDLTQATDPTEHFHRLNIEKGDHTYSMVTDAVEISPDELTTTLNLTVDDAVSIDSVASPFIVLEYLIKF